MNSEFKPILTVAIPTYNRSKTLKRVLLQLKKEKNQNFQILVSDNDSSDNTKTMVSRYRQSVRNLEYHRNDKNLGYSGNILKLYELTKTRYVWFIADDEEVLPGAIDRILQSLRRYRPVVAVFNHLKIDPYGREVEDGVRDNIVHSKIESMKSYKSILRMGFLSIVVIEKRLSLNAVRRICDENNIYFQISLALLLLSNKFNFCEIALPIVFRNQSYRSGEFYKFIMTGIIDAILISKNKLNKKILLSDTRRQVFQALELYLCQKLGLFKFYGRPTLTTLEKVFLYYGFISVFIVSFPIIYHITPAFLLKLLYKSKLVKIHGEKGGIVVYNENINRVFSNKTNSGFINYR
jgi:glycosyltransferase involved in cell wall biosynthesis